MPQSEGSKLKKLRETAGVSQYQLAGFANISRDRISRVECHYAELSPQEWRRIERAIDTAIAEKQSRLAKLYARERENVTAVDQALA